MMLLPCDCPWRPAWRWLLAIAIVPSAMNGPEAHGEKPPSLPAKEAAAEEKADEEQAKQAAKRDAAALEWILRRGLRAVVPVPVQPMVEVDEAVEPQFEQQIDQHANQLERQLQPVLASELEMVRLACGDLSTAARKGVLKAGQEAHVKASRNLAKVQLRGQWNNNADADPRKTIREGLAKALRDVASPEQIAAYDREHAARASRQAHAARLRIVAQLDQQLDLSTAQRTAIESELVAKWKPEWMIGLAESGMVNDLPIAPDFAAAAIEPHLAAAQKEAWRTWSSTAGSNVVGRQFITWNFDGQGLQDQDEWWKK